MMTQTAMVLWIIKITARSPLMRIRLISTQTVQAMPAIIVLMTQKRLSRVPAAVV